jgi:hypothetical protein
MDTVSESRLSTVNGVLAGKIRELDSLYTEKFPLDCLVVEQGFRRPEEQARLWQEGRDAAGNVINASQIVTHARPGHSFHEYGLAADVCPATLVATVGWSPNSEKWVVLGELGESLGLVWGGRWKSPDRPHFQLTGKFPVSPTDEVRALYASGGLQAVWAASGVSNPTPGPADAPRGPTAPANGIVATVAEPSEPSPSPSSPLKANIAS